MDVDDHEDDNNIGIEVGIGHWGRSWVRLTNLSIGHVDTRECESGCESNTMKCCTN